jgi:hypothetical protein
MSLLVAATVIGRPHIESELSLGEVTIVSRKIGLALLGNGGIGSIPAFGGRG